MWSDLRPKMRISALLRVMRAHEKGSHEAGAYTRPLFSST